MRGHPCVRRPRCQPFRQRSGIRRTSSVRRRSAERDATMSITFRLLTEQDVRSVLTMDDLIETMAAALKQFSTGGVVQPVRSVIPVSEAHGTFAFFATMPALAKSPAALGAKLVTV